MFPSEDGHGFTTDVCAECWTELCGGNSAGIHLKKEQLSSPQKMDGDTHEMSVQIATEPDGGNSCHKCENGAGATA